MNVGNCLNIASRPRGDSARGCLTALQLILLVGEPGAARAGPQTQQYQMLGSNLYARQHEDAYVQSARAYSALVPWTK